MVSNVVLGNSSRSNLLSIRNTSRIIDATTLRLATGRRVNSALDNPDNFFSSRALKNKASDLQHLLDAVGRNIRTIQQAEAGIETVTDLIQQVDTIADQAIELIINAPTEGRVTGNVDLRAVNDLTNINGINNGDQIKIKTRDPEEVVYFPPVTTITITSGMSSSALLAQINAINDPLPEDVIKASLNEDGYLEIKSVKGDLLRIEFDAAGPPPNNIANLRLAAALGFAKAAKLMPNGFVFSQVQMTITSERNLTSFSLFNIATNKIARRSDRIAQLEGENNIALFANLNSPGDNYEIGVNGGTREIIKLDNTQTIQGFIDTINYNANLNNLLEADFIENTGQLIIKAIDQSVLSIETGLDGAGSITAFFGFNAGALFSPFNRDVESLILGTIAEPIASAIKKLELDHYNTLRQIDNLVKDSHFSGINLLQNDNMVSIFNSSHSSFLTTKGVNFTASGLGMGNANFSNLADITTAKNNARQATNKVRDFGRSIANDLAIIKIRKNFTEKTIITMKAGSDDLTITDLNEEGANLLALQMRQNIAASILSFGFRQQMQILSIFS